MSGLSRAENRRGLARLVLNGWQPIDGAPLEGEFLIAAHADRDAGRIYIVGEAERDPDEKDQFWWASQRGECWAEPIVNGGWIITHWMPLPKHPAQREAQP